MFRFRKLGLIQVDYLEGNKFTHTLLESVRTADVEKKRAKSNEIILIVLITIFLLLFFARSLTVFLILLILGLIIGAFALIKDYKERRRG